MEIDKKVFQNDIVRFYWNFQINHSLVFPKCAYKCKSIEIYFDSEQIPNPEWDIMVFLYNDFCPIEIEIIITGNRKSTYKIKCNNHQKVTTKHKCVEIISREMTEAEKQFNEEFKKFGPVGLL